MTGRPAELRLVEAMLFAAAAPVEEAALAARLPDGCDLPRLLALLQAEHADRGVVLMRVAGGWAFRTAPDLARTLALPVVNHRRPSRAAVETLAIIAYHQPVTRAEVEQIRGVAAAKGTFDLLLEAGWIEPGPRREQPGRPLTWRTSRGFLDHFGLASLDDLPALDELKAAGLLDRRAAIATLPGGRVAEAGGGPDDPAEPSEER